VIYRVVFLSIFQICSPAIFDPSYTYEEMNASDLSMTSKVRHLNCEFCYCGSANAMEFDMGASFYLRRA